MGTLLEGLWLFAVNRELAHRYARQWELAWLPDHDYNDFALLACETPWDRTCRAGEILRVEAKSMVLGADESKAHFDEPVQHIGPHDQLLVLLWRWEGVGDRVQPIIVDWFLGSAREVCTIRDALHVARGGSFVDRLSCPDGCAPTACRHDGEPLNADGKRERKSGPASCRVSSKTSFAANFGGMVRMLKADGATARATLRMVCASNATAKRYVALVWRNLPNEEAHHFSKAEWCECATRHRIPIAGVGKADLVAAVRAQVPDYQEDLLASAAEG